jgi:hypothetical protein
VSFNGLWIVQKFNIFGSCPSLRSRSYLGDRFQSKCLIPEVNYTILISQQLLGGKVCHFIIQPANNCSFERQLAASQSRFYSQRSQLICEAVDLFGSRFLCSLVGTEIKPRECILSILYLGVHVSTISPPRH